MKMPPEPRHTSNENLDDNSSNLPNVQWNLSSEDEEESQNDDLSTMGYMPIPQNFEQDEVESIDYSSVNSLMAAVNAHGVNTINDSAEETAASSQIAANSLQLIQQAAEERKQEEITTAAAVWNTPSERTLELDKEKEEKIKSMMSNFTLPVSAVPSWAQNMSDEDLNNLVLEKASYKNK